MMNENEKNEAKELIEVKVTLKLTKEQYHIARVLSGSMKHSLEDYISMMVGAVGRQFIEDFHEKHKHVTAEEWDDFHKFMGQAQSRIDFERENEWNDLA